MTLPSFELVNPQNYQSRKCKVDEFHRGVINADSIFVGNIYHYISLRENISVIPWKDFKLTSLLVFKFTVSTKAKVIVTKVLSL